jgi:DNA polymerase
MGKDKFKATLKIGHAGVSVDMPLSDAERVVNLYRQKYPYIVALWKQGQEALDAMIKGYEYDLGVGIKLKCKDNKIWLPNGMFVNYPNLRKVGNEYLYDARYGANKIYGGKVIENVVQALARIIVFDQMAKIDQQFRKKDSKANRFKVVLTVHDEVVACVPEKVVDKCVEYMEKAMSVPPSWCADLPIACEANYGDNYGECK